MANAIVKMETTAKTGDFASFRNTYLSWLLKDIVNLRESKRIHRQKGLENWRPAYAAYPPSLEWTEGFGEAGTIMNYFLYLFSSESALD
jgi:hypothetical protein